MEADFSGYATKAGLKCSDGRTIMPDAFKHNDGMKVPLVWQHGHHDPANILGHAILENREDGVYTYCFFNETAPGKSAKILVQHGDITALSIYANKLVERAKSVFHGVITEVSLVLSGANPGALIDNVSLAHVDGEVETLDDEAIIYTGLTIEHEQHFLDKPVEEVVVKHVEKVEDKLEEPTVQDVYDSFSEQQKEVVHFMIGAALESSATEVEHSSDDTQSDDDNTDNSIDEGDLTHKEGTEMTRNVFEQNGETKAERPSLTHSQMQEIIVDAQKTGSFKESFLAHVATYGIENIEFLFPDAKTVTSVPDVIGRRQEWVSGIINGAKHSPFSRIKSTAVDLTADEARAKGYVKATLKKDEIVKLLKRVTTPTTVYKKQKLDRDDIIDITDLDVVAWLKAEMRVMLDEELARAVLVGDGREIDDLDKINEDCLRPIAWDNDMYAHQITVATAATPDDLVEAVLRSRTYYKGTGTPTFYTTDTTLTDLILSKDTIGRRIYTSEADLAATLRVKEIVTVPVMEGVPFLIGIIVNISDYTIGADKGGAISFFDDFDIDYNQYKYLLETRVSGALTKPKSAIVLKRTPGTVVVPIVPTYNPATKVITIPTQAGVEYRINNVIVTGAQNITQTTEVKALPLAGFSFPHNTDTDWMFTYTA